MAPGLELGEGVGGQNDNHHLNDQRNGGDVYAVEEVIADFTDLPGFNVVFGLEGAHTEGVRNDVKIRLEGRYENEENRIEHNQGEQDQNDLFEHP